LFDSGGQFENDLVFSAFTVLIYYSICNLSALRLPPDERMFPRWWVVGGLICCLVLAFFVNWLYWAVGVGFIVVGLLFQLGINRYYKAGAGSVVSPNIIVEEEAHPLDKK
jgi:APA family basic amino acid/polyamine antiporter